MPSSIPLIRASALIPAEMWLVENERSAEDLLMAAGLPPSPSAAPVRLVSLHSLFALLAALAAREGPDFGARIATPEALMRLGAPARAVRASQTIREALVRVAMTFHLHASHIVFRVDPAPGGLALTEAIPIVAPAEAHHQAQQHIAGFVSCLGRLAIGHPLPASIRITPHPRHGVEHLKPLLGPDIQGEEGRQLRIWISDKTLDVRFPWMPMVEAPDRSESFDGAARQSLAESARILVEGMVEDGNPEMGRLALCAGRSRRTLQRLLATDGTSFAELLDSVRQDLALQHLATGGPSMLSIAQSLGYRSPSSLTRSGRRWTDASPRLIRLQKRMN